MTSQSAGSQSEEKDFLKAFIDPLIRERIPKNTDYSADMDTENTDYGADIPENTEGQVSSSIPSKVQRGVIQIWHGRQSKSQATG